MRLNMFNITRKISYEQRVPNNRPALLTIKYFINRRPKGGTPKGFSLFKPKRAFFFFLRFFLKILFN